MNTAVNIARIVALACASAFLISGVRLLDALKSETAAREEVTRKLPEILHAEAQLIRGDVSAQITAARRDIRSELAATREMTDARIASLEATADSRLAAIQADVTPLAAGIAREMTSAIGEYRRIPGTVGARLDRWTECSGNGNCWQSQITATLGATRATMGAVAKAAPGIAEAMDRSANSTEKATSATADAMRNIAEVSRPLPRWVRVPLQILGPTTPIWLPFTIK